MHINPNFSTFLEEIESELSEDGNMAQDAKHMSEMLTDWGLPRLLTALKFSLKGSEDELESKVEKVLTDLQKELKF